jgi:hypothetical protein
MSRMPLSQTGLPPWLLRMIDMIKPFEFPGADIPEPRALPIVPAIENLIQHSMPLSARSST